MNPVALTGSGESISAIAFGSMRLSLDGRPASEASERVIEAALDAGFTFIDTADAYCLDDDEVGHNERLVAKVVRRRPDRDAIRIATKAGMRRPRGAWMRDGSPEHIRRSCERSLRALGVDRIFLYQFHAPDGHVPFEASVETFAELQREGKCAHIGLSNVNTEHIAIAARIVDVVSVQNRLSPYYRESVIGGVVAECERRGIAFLAYRPAGGDRLANKLRELAAVREVAERRGISSYLAALGWVRAQGARVVPLIGATTREHAIESALAADLTLAPDEIRTIDDAQWIANVRFCAL